MASPKHHELKIIAGTFLVISVVLSLLDKIYAPSYLEFADSRPLPNWVSWFGLALAAIGTVIFLVIEAQQWKANHNHSKAYSSAETKALDAKAQTKEQAIDT